jgi:hypothetical protein
MSGDGVFTRVTFNIVVERWGVVRSKAKQSNTKWSGAERSPFQFLPVRSREGAMESMYIASHSRMGDI